MIKLINMKNARNEGTIKSVTRRRNMNVTKHSEPKCEISLHEFELRSYQNLIGHSP